MKRFKHHIRKKTILAVISLLVLIGGGIGAGLALLHPKSAGAAWYSSTWSKRKKITIDNTKVSGSSDLTNFPVLINVTDPNIKDNAQPDGDDILFTSADGSTKLNHEIESYFPATGQVIAWVQVPTLSATLDTVMYMYYGNASATSQESIAATWDSNYNAVYHMAEDPEGSEPSVLNSENNTLEGYGYGDTRSGDLVSGKIGYAHDYDSGSTDRLEMIDNHSGSELTISGWVKMSGVNTSGWQTLIQRDTTSGTWFDFQLYAQADDAGGVYGDSPVFRIDANGNEIVDYATEQAIGGATLTTGTWFYFVGTYDGSALRFYRDGSLVESTTCTSCTISDSNDRIIVGYNGVWGEGINGQIDEIRVSNTARSTDWIATEYANMNSPDTFYTYGSEESQPGNGAAGEQPILYWNADEGFGTTVNDASGNGNSGTRTNATWQTEDMCVSGKCLYFDGTGDYVSRSADADLDFAAADSFSIGGWFRHAPKTSGTEVLIARHNTTGTDGGFKIYMESDGDITCGIDRDSTFSPEDSVTSTAATYDDNQWHHVACVKNGTSSLTLYIDGNSVGTPDVSIASTGTYANADTVYVGIDGDGSSNAFTGFIDDVKIYRYARSAAQVAADTQRVSGLRGAAVVMGAADNALLNDGLIGYWKMDEASWTVNCSTGSVLDSSGNGLHGLACPNSTGPAGGATGKFGKGGSFDGSNDYVSISDSAVLSPNTISISMWYKPAALGSVGGAQTLIEHDHSASPWAGFSIEYSTSNAIECYIRNQAGDNTYLYVNGITSTTTWYHIACTWDGTTAKLYVNGQLSSGSSASFSGTSTFNADSSLTIGTGDSGYGFMTEGLIDEVRLYNRALSKGEVEKLYAWAPGPHVYLPFDEGSGTTTVYDKSGNGLHGTMNTFSENAWVPGKFGSALNFDGISDYITVPTTNFSSTDYTYEAWVYPKVLAVDDSFFTLHDGAGGDELRIDVDDSPDFDVVSNGTGGVVNGTNDVVVNRWYHVAVTRSGSEITLYINGVVNATGTDGTAYTIGSPLGIGADNSSTASKFFTGPIDEVRIYNYARTQQQVVEDMNGGHPTGGSPIGSQALHWKFDEMYGTTTYDGLGYSNGTITGALWNSGNITGSCAVNTCLSFDGAADAVTIPTASDGYVDFGGAEAFTVSLWADLDEDNLPTGTQEDALVAKWQDALSDYRSYRLFVSNDGSNKIIITAEIYDESTDQSITAAYNTGLLELSPSGMTHVAFTFNGGTSGAAGDLKLYLNGMLKAENTANGSFLGMEDTASDFTVGDYDTTDVATDHTSYDGVIDEVKVYSSALTQDQIMIDMNAGSSITLSVRGASEVSAQTPVAYYDFDHINGTTVYDSSGSGLNGTISGNLPVGTGKFGKGIAKSANVNANYVSIADNDTFSINSTNQFTAMAWVKLNNKDDWNYVLTKRAGSNYEWDLKVNGAYGGQVSAHIMQSSSTTFMIAEDLGYPIVTGNWYHIAMVADLSQPLLQLYVNGELVGEDATSTGSYTNGTEPVRIGSAGDGGPFGGTIDEVKFYNTALTPTQIMYDYNRGAPSRWYKLDECTGTTVYDSALTGNGDATGVNGTITAGDTSGSNDSVGSCTGSAGEMWKDGVDGKFNASLEFDGTNDYVSIASPSLPTGDFTYSVWFYHTANSSDTILYAGDGSGGNEFKIDRPASTEVRVRVSDSTACTGGAVPELNTWNHFAVTRSGSTVAGYLNGVPACTGTNSSTLNFGSCPLLIGADDSSVACDQSGINEVWAGKIDDVRIYQYPLSATQIKNVINEGSAARFGPKTGNP